MARKTAKPDGQISFDLEALMAADPENENTAIEDFLENADDMVYCANLGCGDWGCSRHNRNAPWGEICNFRQFPGGKDCKGRL